MGALGANGGQHWVGGNSMVGGGKALRALNARWALPVYPVFEDEK